MDNKLVEIPPINETDNLELDSRSSGVLVVDMQNDLVREVR
ncbi:hypothetical protein MetMK1DRAFT_00026350 [Metallosphaera yellowstonensis MK1]|jgi:hypothetical protein|uniref:Uncharacterized protein n=1 Tax=Metallosphaera yellowstonensis MK1 TaxID=671065 RepID=H2C7T6_9CREN|nr:hypothetical protein [Metallosphaera yellowstonensis]EHP68212.1 hypothetical protein MetMK1DRAFT_00026350 [Metallosphaera yellowstonensis MK1]